MTNQPITLARNRWCRHMDCMHTARRNVAGYDYCKDHSEQAVDVLLAWHNGLLTGPLPAPSREMVLA